MPGRVCRISWRKGSRLSLVISPRVGFLDLPREVRDQIYIHSFSALDPITVWSGSHEYVEDKRASTSVITFTSSRTVRVKFNVLDSLAMGLLSSNRQVSQEAAAVFYGANTFRFFGDRNWSPLYSFLEMIGQSNRDSLRYLEVRVPQPERLWQHADGTRTTIMSWPFREVVPRSRFLPPDSPPFAEQVDHVDPAIEACFRVIGKRTSPLSLVLDLDNFLLPGVTLYDDPHSGGDWTFSMDMPTVVEAVRNEFTADDNLHSNVQVRWKGEYTRDQFKNHATAIEEKGWMVLEAREKHFFHDRYSKTYIQFTLCRTQSRP